MPDQPTKGQLREILAEVFKLDGDFDAFLIDHFEDVFQRYTVGMDRVQKVNLLLATHKAPDVLGVLRELHPGVMLSVLRRTHPGLLMQHEIDGATQTERDFDPQVQHRIEQLQEDTKSKRDRLGEVQRILVREVMERLPRRSKKILELVPDPLPLSGLEQEEFYNALIDAFRSVDEVRQLVRFGLDKNLDEIAVAENLGVVVFNLVQYVESHGLIHELLIAALRQNPRNARLRAFNEFWNGRA